MVRKPIVYQKLPKLGTSGMPMWATYIANRYPHFKVHEKIGPAKAAITSHDNGVMYKMVAAGDTLSWRAVAVVNEGESAGHPYKKIKPTDDLEPVCVFRIEEDPL